MKRLLLLGDSALSAVRIAGFSGPGADFSWFSRERRPKRGYGCSAKNRAGPSDGGPAPIVHQQRRPRRDVMADSPPLDPTDLIDDAQPIAVARPSMMAKVNVLLILMALVGVQCLAAYWIIPSPEEVAASLGAQLPAAGAANAAQGDEETADIDLSKQVEVDLGEFRPTSYQPMTETQLRIEFTLWGTVNIEDEVEFLEIYEKNKHRFRDEVNTVVRAAALNDLTAAELGLIRRKILEKSNRIFGRPYLKAIVFSEFNFYEQ